ncbi:MAG TPA: glycosyltransferase family 4 protein [Ktedonobacteraceae bacterium]|nr:glycosyltransferase family 4 protein [Ktedonobacteraceae bacterium]
MKKYHAVGGMQMQVYLLTEALSRLGVEQEIITVRPPWDAAFEQWDNVTIRRYGLPIPVDRQLYEAPAFIAALRYASNGFDLVHIHHGEDIAAIPIGLVAAKHAHIPVIITLHNSWNLTYHRSSPLPGPKELLGRHIEKIGISHADALCALTGRTAKLLASNFNIPASRLFTTPDGIDLSFFRPQQDYPLKEFLTKHNIPASSHYVLFVGRLKAQKGIPHLLNAAAMLKKQGEDFTLIISGDGDERQSLQSLAKQLGLTDTVFFTGYLHHDDLPCALSLASVFVMPSNYEELGSVILEAMAMQKAIVATNVGGIPEIITHQENGLLVPPARPENLATAISTLLNDSDLARRLATQASSDAQKYGLQALASRLLDIYSLISCK